MKQVRAGVKKFLCVTVFFLFVSLANAQQPPVAPVRNVVDDYHGTKITDPYRYMENLKDPEVQQWIKGQADYTASVLKQIPGRDALLERIKALDSGTPFRIFYFNRRADGTI